MANSLYELAPSGYGAIFQRQTDLLCAPNSLQMACNSGTWAFRRQSISCYKICRIFNAKEVYFFPKIESGRIC